MTQVISDLKMVRGRCQDIALGCVMGFYHFQQQDNITAVGQLNQHFCCHQEKPVKANKKSCVSGNGLKNFR